MCPSFLTKASIGKAHFRALLQVSIPGAGFLGGYTHLIERCKSD